MYTIKFGTDGWREIIADQFTVANVRRVADATARYLLQQNPQASCVVGHDCRFGGAMFAEETARVLAGRGVKVHLCEGYVSTPMISLATRNTQSDAGIIITASHNPPSYNGYKIKASYGGPAIPEVITEVEQMIEAETPAPAASLASLRENGKVLAIEAEKMYIDHARASFDMDKLGSMGSALAYDAMFGAGQNVVRSLFPDAALLHCDHNPGFHGRAPEPIL